MSSGINGHTSLTFIISFLSSPAKLPQSTCPHYNVLCNLQRSKEPFSSFAFPRYASFPKSKFSLRRVPILYSDYWSILAYNQSKLCNMLFAQELHRRFKLRGVFCNAVHPGNLVSSGLQRHSCFMRFIHAVVSPFTKSLVSLD